MPANPPFSILLRTTRERLGLTQQAAADLLEVSKSSIEKWEAGGKVPLPVTQEGVLARLASYKPKR